MKVRSPLGKAQTARRVKGGKQRVRLATNPSAAAKREQDMLVAKDDAPSATTGGYWANRKLLPGFADAWEGMARNPTLHDSAIATWLAEDRDGR